MTTQPFGLVHLAIVEAIETRIAAADKVGGSLAFTLTGPTDYHIVVLPVPGGSADQIEGDFIYDIDVFAQNFNTAYRRANQLSAALVGPRIRTAEMFIDSCVESEGPTPRPWDDEGVHRIGGTWVFTARRPSSA